MNFYLRTQIYTQLYAREGANTNFEFSSDGEAAGVVFFTLDLESDEDDEEVEEDEDDDDDEEEEEPEAAGFA